MSLQLTAGVWAGVWDRVWIAGTGTETGTEGFGIEGLGRAAAARLGRGVNADRAAASGAVDVVETGGVLTRDVSGDRAVLEEMGGVRLSSIPF